MPPAHTTPCTLLTAPAHTLHTSHCPLHTHTPCLLITPAAHKRCPTGSATGAPVAGQDPSKVDYMMKCDKAPPKPFDCSKHYCLFNVTADPCEHHDLSATVQAARLPLQQSRLRPVASLAVLCRRPASIDARAPSFPQPHRCPTSYLRSSQNWQSTKSLRCRLLSRRAATRSWTKTTRGSHATRPRMSRSLARCSFNRAGQPSSSLTL